MAPATPPNGSRSSMPYVLLFFLLLAVMALGRHLYARWAPPLARTVELVEKDQKVEALVGSPAKVSLTSTRRLRRDPLHAIRGQDLLNVLTTVSGPRGEATFRLEARNVNGQGWAGTFAVESSGQTVLKNGQYVTEGPGVILEGDFAPDGTPRPKN